MLYNNNEAAAILSLVDKVEVVSFDLFDTLIVRNVLHPSDVFSIVGKRAGLALDFREMRETAQRYARDRFQPQVQNHETTLTEIYAALERYGLETLCSQSLNAIMTIEMDTEKECIRPNTFMLNVFSACKAAGKRTIITSDTYFERPFLNALLTQCGYTEYDELIISSEIGRAKHDGSIWPWLVDHMGVLASKILHIGDNIGADFIRPRRAGLRCFHYRAALALALENPDYRRVHDLFSPSERTEEPISRWLACIANHAFTERSAAKYDGFRWFGLTSIGVVLVLFAHWLHQSAKRDGVERLLFLARDGYLLEQIYTALYPIEAGGIPAAYTYASRRAFRVPAIARIDDATLRMLTDFNHAQTVRFHLDALGLTPDDHLTAVQKAGFADLDALVPRQRTDQLVQLLRDLEAVIVEHAAEERVFLERYLYDSGALNAASVGLVDVGWNGSLQKAYAALVNNFWSIEQTINGYYVGLREPTVVFDKTGSLRRMRGFVCDLGTPRENLDLVYDGATLIEFALYAPHGTSLRFDSRNGKVAPILDDTKIGFNIDASCRIQLGVHDLVKITKELDLSGIDNIEPFLRPLKRIVHRPTKAEARLLGGFMLSTEIGKYTSLIPMARPRLANPLHLYREFKSSTWPRGYLRQIPFGRAIHRAATADHPAVVLTRRLLRKVLGLLRHITN